MPGYARPGGRHATAIAPCASKNRIAQEQRRHTGAAEKGSRRKLHESAVDEPMCPRFPSHSALLLLRDSEETLLLVRSPQEECGRRLRLIFCSSQDMNISIHHLAPRAHMAT